jgi:vacuolar-type H+-ATPase subunit E/Vma4
LSIQELKGEIDRKSQEEISAVLENAKKEAENIITQANTKAEALKIEKERSIARESEAKERAELATIRIDRKGELLRKRSELCDRVFDEAEKRITQIAESAGPEYRDFIVKLTVQGPSLWCRRTRKTSQPSKTSSRRFRLKARRSRRMMLWSE